MAKIKLTAAEKQRHYRKKRKLEKKLDQAYKDKHRERFSRIYKMKYGLRRANQSVPESDEEWKIAMEKNIAFLNLEIRCLKMELEESKRKIELLTPKNPFASGFPSNNNINQHQCNTFPSVCNTWPSKPFNSSRPSWWQYPTCGTKATPYQATFFQDYSNKPNDTRYMCITTMREYLNKSLEELRFEDYVARDGLNSSKVAGQNVNGDCNTFPDSRSCFGPSTSLSKSFNFFKSQSQNSGAAKTDSKQEMLINFLNGTNEKPEVFHKPDCFDSLIQKEMLGQVLSKLNKMDKYFYNVNNRLTSVDSHLADIGSSVSIMESRLSAIDMHITMQRMNKKWKGLESSLTSLEASPFDQKKDSILPSREVFKTSTSLQSDQESPFKEEMSLVLSNLSTTNVSATEKKETFTDETYSKMGLSESDLNTSSKCTRESSSFSYKNPVSFTPMKEGSSTGQKNTFCTILFGSANNKSDSKMDIVSNESSPLSFDKNEKNNEDLNEKQKESLSKSPFTCVIKNKSKDCTECIVVGEQERAVSCIDVDKQKSPNISHNLAVEKEKNLNTPKPSESITSGVTEEMLVINQSDKNEETPLVSENLVLTKKDDCDTLRKSNTVETITNLFIENTIGNSTCPRACGDIGLCSGTIPGVVTEIKNKNYEQKTSVGCQTENIITSTVTANILSSETKVNNPLKNQKTSSISENTNKEQRLTAHIEPQNLQVSEVPGNLYFNCLVPNVCNENKPPGNSKSKTKMELVIAVADEANNLNNEYKSDEEHDFVVVEKSDVCFPDQDSFGNEQYSVLSEASTDKIKSFNVCNDITEYLEINLGKKKDAVYEFGFEVKADCPAESTLDISARDFTADGEISNTDSANNSTKDDSFQAFLSNFIGIQSINQSSPLVRTESQTKRLRSFDKLKPGKPQIVNKFK